MKFNSFSDLSEMDVQICDRSHIGTAHQWDHLKSVLSRAFEELKVRPRLLIPSHPFKRLAIYFLYASLQIWSLHYPSFVTLNNMKSN